MPKQRITREMVVDAAFSIAREQGMEQVLVKNIARRLECSAQPIYSYCRNMEDLRNAVMQRACETVRKEAAAHVDPADRFRSTGRAWLYVAKHEPRLFKLFLACRRQDVASWEALYRTEADPSVAESIANGLGLDAGEAQRLYLQMLVYTVGLGTIFAMTEISPEEIFARQEDAYEAFFRQAAIRRTQKGETQNAGTDDHCL